MQDEIRHDYNNLDYTGYTTRKNRSKEDQTMRKRTGHTKDYKMRQDDKTGLNMK